MSASLSSAAFTDFYTAVHGYPPFPWQQDLAAELLDGAPWPEAVDVPTGLGKTSLIDVAVFALAARAPHARRRVFFVVDRRLVVDEAYEHANALAHALDRPDQLDATTDQRRLVTDVARRLSPDEGAVPLETGRMRGGTTWSWRWVKRPDAPAVVVGTVDQIGSRLLMRGYGLSPYLAPIDAALVGNDSLILCDEAHLSPALLSALDRATNAANSGAAPVVVPLSATMAPGHSTGPVHSISPADLDHPVAGARLNSARRIRLAEAKTSSGVAASMARWAKALAQPKLPGQVVLTVCNTVARARAVHSELAKRGVDEQDRTLLIGRSRPIDRDHLLATTYPHMRLGRERSRGRVLHVVATQTVEVGANIDADALVSESASYSAMVQRLGRLGRAPEQRDEETFFPAVVVHDPAADKNPDPVYGTARASTWKWLSGLTEPTSGAPRGKDPFGPLEEALAASPRDLDTLRSELEPEQVAAMEPEPAYVPHLWDHTLGLWAQTSPRPRPDPPLAPYLHGLDSRPADVQVVWRGDLIDSELPPPGKDVPEALAQRLAALPPASEEMLAISIAALRRWASGADPVPVDDLEGGREAPEARQPGTARIGLRWRNCNLESIDLRRARPGDTVIVPSEAGGCDRFGWNPHSTERVADVADLALRRGRPCVRLAPDLIHLADASTLPAVEALLEARAEATDEEEPTTEDVSPALGLLFPSEQARGPLDHAQRLRLNLGRIAGSPAIKASGEREWVLTRDGATPGFDSDSTGSASASLPQDLEEHQEEVARQAAQFARNLGLPEDQVRAVWAAARFHDEGKRDPRFQAMLHGLTPEAVRGLPVLAKSGLDPMDRRAYRLAKRRSTYPVGMRHEALSVAIARHRLAAQDWDVDADLVLHLIAAHHGRGRPFVPPVDDPQPVEVPVPGAAVTVRTDELHDTEQPARFARLQRQHGRWRLALLEAVVRMADIWCSAGDKPTDAAPSPMPRRRAEGKAVERSEPSHRVPLPALDGRDPLAFLTALGTLRLLSEELGLPARLSFDPLNAMVVLTSPLPDLDSLSEALTSLVAGLGPDGLLPGMPEGWPPRLRSDGKAGDPLRVVRQAYPRLVGEAGVAGEAWLRVISTDLAVDPKGRCALTPFMAPAGRQTAGSFFTFPLEVVRAEPSFIREAFTDWRCQENFTGEYLDHRAIRTAGDLPTGESTPAGVPGATWLAAQALPLLHLSGNGENVFAALWQRLGKRKVLRWPVWSDELDLDAVRAMLTLPVLNRTTPEEDGHGITVPLDAVLPWGMIAMGAAERLPLRNSAGPLAPVDVRLI